MDSVVKTQMMRSHTGSDTDSKRKYTRRRPRPSTATSRAREETGDFEMEPEASGVGLLRPASNASHTTSTPAGSAVDASQTLSGAKRRRKQARPILVEDAGGELGSRANDRKGKGKMEAPQSTRAQKPDNNLKTPERRAGDVEMATTSSVGAFTGMDNRLVDSAFAPSSERKPTGNGEASSSAAKASRAPPVNSNAGARDPTSFSPHSNSVKAVAVADVDMGGPSRQNSMQERRHEHDVKSRSKMSNGKGKERGTPVAVGNLNPLVPTAVSGSTVPHTRHPIPIGRGGGFPRGGRYARGGTHGGQRMPAAGGRPGASFSTQHLHQRIRITDDRASRDYSDASRQVLEMREDVRQRVQNAVQREFGMEYTVELFGSTRYGVSFSDSDLDMVIIDPRNPRGFVLRDYLEPIYDTRRLAKCIRRARFINTQSIPRSKVPIVKFKDPITSLECDLNINQMLGIINSDMIKAYTSLYPPLRSLIYDIKEWAKPLGLNNPSGTKDVPTSWSSYSLVSMAVAWCMHQGLVPNLQAGLPPMPMRAPSRSHSSRSSSRASSRAVLAPDANSGSETELHIHLADFERTRLSRESERLTSGIDEVVGPQELVWTLKPHQGWDARYRSPDAQSVKKEMVEIGRREGSEGARRGLFSEWLFFWSQFDFERKAVCIRLPGGIVDRDSREVTEAAQGGQGKVPAPVCVVDPFIRTKNCTAGIAQKTLERFKVECAKAAREVVDDVRPSRDANWSRERRRSPG